MGLVELMRGLGQSRLAQASKLVIESMRFESSLSAGDQLTVSTHRQISPGSYEEAGFLQQSKLF